MKIIRTDSFNREGPGHDDNLVAECTEWWGEHLVALLNVWACRDPNTSDYYKLVKDDYIMKEFKP